MNLSEIIEALEKAEGPSRDIDADIAIATGKVASRDYWSIDYLKAGIVSEYTASVDAALALAERLIPGVWYHIAKGKTRVDEPLYGAAMMLGDEPIGQGEHETSQAIAIVLATLKAIQAKAGATP